MQATQRMFVVTGIALALAGPAVAAVGDPEIIIYRFPGVRDDGGGANTGVATVFHCTNFSGVTETLRFVTRDFDTAIKANNLVPSIIHLSTVTFATHITNAYIDGSLGTGAVTQGTTAIAATSTNIICTAMTIDASSTVPVGVALRGIRFSPVPGSQE